MPTATPIIDFHTHSAPTVAETETYKAMMIGIMGSREKFDEYNAHYSHPENFVAELKKNGVHYAVVLAGYIELCTSISSNEVVEAYCKNHSELIPFCSFNPYSEPDMPGALREMKARGFKGLKLYPSYNQFHMNDAKMYPLYNVAQELNIPVLVHTGTSIFQNTRLKYARPIDLDDVAVDFPDLTILMAHGGRLAWFDEAMTIVRMHKNAHIEISGIPVRKLLQYFPDMERFSSQFVFGTDWPQVVQAKSIAGIQALGLSAEAQARILGGNATKILGL